MKTIVIYKTKYGASKTYAEWIAQELGCEAVNAKEIKPEKLTEYDVIIYGGGLYAEIINGVTLITKNISMLQGKKLIVFTTGITPTDVRDYYDKMVIEKNFKNELRDKIKVFNFTGKMVLDELSFVHKTALKSLKKLMSGKENPTEMEKMLVDLCDADGDFCSKEQIKELVEYAAAKNN